MTAIDFRAEARRLARDIAGLRKGPVTREDLVEAIDREIAALEDAGRTCRSYRRMARDGIRYWRRVRDAAASDRRDLR